MKNMKTRTLALLICNVSIIAVFVLLAGFWTAQQAHAAACPAADGDDGIVDGIITIDSNTTWTPTDGTAWNCAGFNLHVTNSSILTFGSDTANGYYGYLQIYDLTVDSGSSISSDEKGCPANPAASSDGMGPNGSNICTATTAGYGDGDGSSTGSVGGGYGGEGGDGSNKTVGGAVYGSAIAPVLFGSSGGDAWTTNGGVGGGIVRIEVLGNFTHNGQVTADGGNGAGGGSNMATGGGSGGAIYITVTGELSGSTGTFSVDGGAGGALGSYYGGGGGAGRISLSYGSDGFTGLDSADFSAAGGAAGGGSAVAGSKGTVYTKNTGASSVKIYHGYQIESDLSATTVTFDSSATNVYCSATLDATPSFSTTDILFAGTIDCSSEAIISFDVAASNSMDFTSVTMSLPAEVIFTFDDAASMTMTGSTINGNINWQNITDANIDGSSTINANSKGCEGTAGSSQNGSGPDGSNVCTVDTAGYSDGAGSSEGTPGAGHGGQGGVGSTLSIGRATYGSETAPVLFGSSSGDGWTVNGSSGGGLIRIEVEGDFVQSGDLSVDGANGTSGGTNDATGGGSGGSIYITSTGQFSGTDGTLSADGGDGGAHGGGYYGGGGGGGRIRVEYGSDSSNYLSGFAAAAVTAAGASGGGAAAAGSTGTLSTADIYGPSISSALTGDTDADGQIDAIVLTMSEDVSGGTVAGADFTLSDSYSVASASRTDTSQITIVVTEAGTDTDATPTVTIAGSIDDTSANSTTSGSQAATDGAAPQISSFSYRDADANGKIDSVEIYFSETIADASVLAAEDLIFTNVGDFTGAVFGSGSTDKAVGSIGAAIVTFGTESTVVDTNEGSGNFAISSQNNFSLTDGTNTNTTLGAQSNASVTDSAGPVITNIAPAHDETNVSQQEDIVVTFSEAITTGSAAYTITDDPGGTSNAWTSGDTILTISHDQFQGSTDYIFEMTAAPDASGQTVALAGAISGVTNPATFTTASAGGVSVSSSAPDPSISHTDDEGNALDSISESSNAAGSGTCETGLNPGEDIALSWSSNSSVNLVNLYYSTDAGSTYSLIEGPITNTENYSWTIPSDIAGSTLQFKIEGTDLAEITATFETESCVLNGADDGTESDDTTDAEDSTSEVTEPTTGETGYSPVTGELEDISVVNAGDYIRSSYFSTVYYIQADGDDLVRRPFMNAQTFFTYQDDFSSVKTVTDATLSTIDLGQPMLPNPGVVLIKIQSDPKVYAIDTDGVTIRWITTEDIATTLYGDNWNEYIIDIEATFFPRFTRGSDIEQPDDFTSAGKSMKTRQELAG